MGPKIFGVLRGETVYSLRALPFGGFVRVASAVGALPEDPPVAPERIYESRSLKSRLVFVAAGPLMNLVLAVTLMVAVFGVIGVDEAILDSTVIGDVVAGGPAAQAGLRGGDRILSVDGLLVSTWTEMVGVVEASLGRSIKIVYQRDADVVSVTVAPAPHPRDPSIGFLGVATTVRVRRLPLWAASARAFTETGRMLTIWFQGIAGLFSGGGAPDVSGPVGIIQMLGEATRFGLANFFYLAAMISANFALINLFPIPALDGSRLVFLAVEWVRGRPVPPEQEGKVHMVGYALLMGLLVLLTYRDLLRLGGGGSP
jgi:regulator of sigma E protease